MGHNFLYLLEAAKKNILQPGCAVVPCAASLYVMGINIETQTVAGYDLSGLNKYRSANQPRLQARRPLLCIAFKDTFIHSFICMHAHSFVCLFIFMSTTHVQTFTYLYIYITYL